MNPRAFLTILALILASAAPAMALPGDGGEIFPSQTWTLGALPSESAPAEPRSARVWRVTFAGAVAAPGGPLVIETAATTAGRADAEQRPVAFTYSDGYNTRRKIHMIASYATLPLFVAQYLVGQDLYNGTGDSDTKSLHGALTVGIATLFAVNTVTGGWNFWEARKDPNGKSRRLIHSLMMFGADIGFVATGALAPDDDDEGGGGGGSSQSLHRNVAITSMSLAVASYVYMFVTR